ncbi:MAG TPA: winged helix-turn-helix domain-containing protein, partial [Pyrinomonadaceae bacterium]|nr:winged helix-turn-helix domain-containing protein [Pyrinomonadaceae bacterium]
MSHLTKHFYEFGSFRLDTGERILMCEGQLVPLTPKAFETLLVLVESNGRIIDKEELLSKIWPDTFVEEVSLAKKISLLRKTLGEDFAHHYIETIPRRGYRFVAEVREVWQESTAQTFSPSSPRGHGTNEQEKLSPRNALEMAEPLDAPATNQHGGQRLSLVSRLSWGAALLVIGLVAGILVWQMATRLRANSSPLPLKTIPLTSFQGRETQVAFSPDGKQVAFVWNGSEGNNPDIYVKLIDAETPLQLTYNPAIDTKPAWSPDGRYLAFLRQFNDRSAYYLIPVLGGAERKL